ncbi:MAG: ribonuclease Z [Flavobacteriaceae bacterium]
MTLEKNDKYTVVIPNLKSSFSEFHKELLENYTKYSYDNVIIDLSKTDITLNDFEIFETISEKQTLNGTSFVIINARYNVDELPETLIVVPSFQEAIDMVEMDEMTRDLDF